MKIKNGVAMWLILGFFIVLTVSIFLAYSISEYFKETVLQRATFVYSNIVKNHATSYGLNEINFNPKYISINQPVFTNFENAIDTPELTMIKMWSTDHTVIYSDDTNLVGKSFYNNNNLNSALLTGQIISRISYTGDSDDAAAQGNEQLMEIYIPLKTDSGHVIGVVELYLAMDLINVYIDNTNWMIFIITAFSTAIFGIIIFLTFIAFRRNVINPIVAIHEQTRKIKEGNFDVKSPSGGYNELKILGREVENMALKIKDQQNKLVKTERVYAIGELIKPTEYA
jgi:methyl-accepting chemotaxis protein